MGGRRVALRDSCKPQLHTGGGRGPRPGHRGLDRCSAVRSLKDAGPRTSHGGTAGVRGGDGGRVPGRDACDRHFRTGLVTDAVYLHHQDHLATWAVLAVGPRPVAPGCSLEAVAPVRSQVQEGDLGLCAPRGCQQQKELPASRLVAELDACGTLASEQPTSM